MSEAIEKLRKQLAEKQEHFAKPRAGAAAAGSVGTAVMDVAMLLFEALESQAKEIEELKSKLEKHK